MIKIKDGAVIDNKQKDVINKIVPFSKGYNLTVTRGHSLPEEQLRLIESYAKQFNLLNKFPEFKSGNLKDKVIIDGKEIYTWQRVWSSLLNLFYTSNEKEGAKINPPIDAECLFDYINNGNNKKGKVIQSSPHIKSIDNPNPCPIDFSGNIDGVLSLNRVNSIITEAKKSGVGIRNITVEPANNCVHIDLE